MHYGETIQLIIAAQEIGKLREVFTPKEVNAVLGITFTGTFLLNTGLEIQGAIRRCSFALLQVITASMKNTYIA